MKIGMATARMNLWTTLVIVLGLSADAAEVKLKRQGYAEGPLVLLADVADIESDDPQEKAALARLRLFPAPGQGHWRTVARQKIRELLELYSVDMAKCRLTGPRLVKITARDASRRQVRRSDDSAGDVARSVQNRLKLAIGQYLQAHVDNDAAWNVAVGLNRRQAYALSDPTTKLTVSGGRQPWVGRQRFRISIDGNPTFVPLLVEANVTLPTMVVVATRKLARDQTIRAADIQLHAARPNGPIGEVFNRVEDVIGWQTVRSISAGAPIGASQVRRPILVRRGDPVSVHVRSGSVMVHTIGAALDDGSLGDLIAVKPQPDGKRYRGRRDKTYSARVVDFQTVEVYARSQSVPTTAITKLPATRGGR